MQYNKKPTKNQLVLITGANGFIGKALGEKLLDKNFQVRGAVRSAKTSLLPDGMETADIDSIDGKTDWTEALDGVDAVVHLAARVHITADKADNPIAAYRQTNVAGTRHLAKIAASMGVRRFVFLSSVKVNGSGRNAAYTENDIPAPADPYAISKHEAEQVLREIADNTGMEVTILRSPLVYGPGVKANFLQLLNFVARGIWLPLSGVKNRRNLIFLGNLVDAVFTCLDHPRAAGKTYLVSDGQDVSTPELIQKIAAALGRPARLFYFPAGLLRMLFKLAGQGGIANRLLDSLCVDGSKIRGELDWRPPFTMQQGLAKTACWYQEIYENRI